MRRWWPRSAPRLWPDSLFGRLVLILVAGLLAAQMLTSTIWFEMRYSQVLEVPTRLVGARSADLLALLDTTAPADRPALLAAFSRPGFHVALHPGPLAHADPPLPEAAPARRDNLQRLLAGVLESRYGRPVPLVVEEISLRDEEGQEAGPLTLFTASQPRGHYHFDLGLADGQWLAVEAEESQGGGNTQPLAALLDYITRIYALRIVVVVLIALVAVRLVLRPLARMSAAADALGRNLDSPPLAVTGPVEVRKAATAFNLMQQRLRAGIAERTRFLAAVSHDLRSPITRLRLRAELLADESLRAKFRKDLDDMEGMVTATLDFIRGAETDELRQEIDIDSLLQGLQADIEESGGQVSIAGHARAPLRGHARSLRRCIANLLENAVRYGGSARVQVDDTAERLRLRIADKGPGIPEDMLEQVFEPYYRLDSSRNASSGGVGLGLSIARTVALAHGGSLTLHNAAGGGLEAELVLPRQAAAPQDTPPSS